MNVTRLSDIKANPIPRALTGFEELDYIYGYSRFPNGSVWGMPQGKISLWAGESGIGKSRLCIEVAKNYAAMGHIDSITNEKIYNKVLYFSIEAELDDFASWAKDTSNFSSFYCSDEDKIDEIIKIIYKVDPDLVFIDSVNEIEDFNGTSKSVHRLIKGTKDKIGLKKVTADVGCHTILLGQLNQDKTIKGGTALPHAVDTALNLTPRAKDSTICFTVSVGIKHRYGKKGSEGTWCHDDEGVKCVSNTRLSDKEWCDSHNLIVSTMAGRVIKELEEEEEVEVVSQKSSFFSFLK